MLVGGQVFLSLGIHPEQAASVRFFMHSGLVLLLGSAVIASGMVGLARGYEKAADQLTRLLGTKQVDESLEVTVGNPAGLHAHNRSFWKAYRHSALAVCLFLIGFLAIAIGLADAGFILYLIGLSGGVAIFGLFALGLVLQGLGGVRRAYRGVANSVQVLTQLPDIIPEQIAAIDSEPTGRWAIRRQRPTSYSRHLDTRGRSQLSVKRGATSSSRR